MLEFDGLNIAVPMKSKGSAALARATSLCNTDFLTGDFFIDCDEGEARDMLKHVGRYPSVASKILDAFREANDTL